MTIGFPEAQAKFEKEYGPFIEEATRVNSLVNKIFGNDQMKLTREADKYIFVLGFAAYKDFEELFILAGNGLSIGAAKILRGMYEKVVTATYLSKFPEQSEDFGAYRAIQWRRMMNRVPAQIRDSMLCPETVKEIEDDFEKAKPRFTDKKGRVRGSWSRLTLDQLAEKAGDDLAAAYTPVYALSSCYIHASLTDLLRRIETENELTRIVVDASVYAPRSTLFHAHLLLWKILRRQNLHFGLRLDAEIEHVQTL